MSVNHTLVLKNIYKNFNAPDSLEPLIVLDDFTIRIEENETVALLGPSGCGKSTALNIAAGFENADRGEALFLGEPIKIPSPERGVVFQSSVLFPWLTVGQNIAYGLKRQGARKSDINQKCNKYLELVGLIGFEHYFPHQLSGGMQQRVSLARVLVMEPEMLLMDEPFASLDAQTRFSMQELLIEISTQLKPSILFITHDVEEALFLSDRVYIMTRLPGSIKHELIMPFPKPRNISLLSNLEFVQLKHKAMKLLFY
ncbi:MAG TPA: ABC transporter ATP-binding protein [Anaerovoracaceae bacterium]|nr:ABC transporter ATP-binding protein [Anaerovoracaceae bacterium]